MNRRNFLTNLAVVLAAPAIVAETAKGMSITYSSGVEVEHIKVVYKMKVAQEVINEIPHLQHVIANKLQRGFIERGGDLSEPYEIKAGYDFCHATNGHDFTRNLITLVITQKPDN